ncbi:maf-like protein [Blakeslea trispora]|nr:maf-like protein [Blakeslea trispora]
MKAKEVFERCKVNPELPDADIVIGADTVVVKDNCVLEKPKDRDHAWSMLQKLNGATHQVLTGVQILYKRQDQIKQIEFVEKTEVTFTRLDNETIKAYIDSNEPFDKAGGYGIQGEASLFVESIHGDYWNVVGLPKNHLFRELLNVRVWITQ